MSLHSILFILRPSSMLFHTHSSFTIGMLNLSACLTLADIVSTSKSFVTSMFTALVIVFANPPPCSFTTFSNSAMVLLSLPTTATVYPSNGFSSGLSGDSALSSFLGLDFDGDACELLGTSSISTSSPAMLAITFLFALNLNPFRKEFSCQSLGHFHGLRFNSVVSWSHWAYSEIWPVHLYFPLVKMKSPSLQSVHFGSHPNSIPSASRSSVFSAPPKTFPDAGCPQSSSNSLISLGSKFALIFSFRAHNILLSAARALSSALSSFEPPPASSPIKALIFCASSYFSLSNPETWESLSSFPGCFGSHTSSKYLNLCHCGYLKSPFVDCTITPNRSSPCLMSSLDVKQVDLFDAA
mmetsp:Transcript_22922/g.39252  ORF Transcript_22922/g.39252 Transcript_22922/m.39252 type:complete len:354 (+) Transcript_22922:5935-6996(+)